MSATTAPNAKTGKELPNSLVDWPATEKYERDRAAKVSVPEAVQLDKEIEEDNRRQEALLPQVAPGLRLPENSGVFLLDNFQGEPQLVEVQQTAGEINRDTKGNIFRGAVNPIAGMKQAIELDGAHAKIQAHADVPSLYINIDDSPQPPEQSLLTPNPVRSPNNRSSPSNRNNPNKRSCLLIASASSAPK